MKVLRNGIFMMLLATLLFTLAACGSETNSDEANEKTGSEAEGQASDGELNIAIDAPPPTLDQPTSTATATRDTSRLIFESLVATDADFNPVPMLAESIESDDNQTYTFHLRQGVKFHNGEEMLAEDVVASMYRWMEKSGLTGNIFNDATWTAQDDYTVVLELAQPSSLTLDTMASAKQAAGIMPKETVESAPVEGVDEYIGTGPYKLVEWKQDQYIHFTRFEDYQPVEMEADGLVGKKEALVKDIYFHIVTDSSTRMSGLQTGQYDFIYGVPYDYYDQLQSDSNLDSLLSPAANAMMAFNNVEGISTNAKLRQAINTALNLEEIMMGAFPNPDFFWLDSGYMDVNIKPWASKAGSEYYNQNDIEKAKQLLEESGYNGEEFKLMATRDYDHHYNLAVVIHEQLKSLGINAKLEIYDWPTVLENSEGKFDNWDAYITTASTVSTPTQLIALGTGWSGDYPEVKDKLLEIETASTLEEAQALWDDLQLLLWEEIQPISHLGGYSSLYGFSKNVEGITETTGPIFWNTTKSE